MHCWTTKKQGMDTGIEAKLKRRVRRMGQTCENCVWKKSTTKVTFFNSHEKQSIGHKNLHTTPCDFCFVEALKEKGSKWNDRH